MRQIFRQLISALHYFHEVKEVAHRGIKPANLMLDQASGSLLVSDFGLSQFFKSRAAAEYAATNKARQQESVPAAKSKPFRH